jgi:hypothetical protein
MAKAAAAQPGAITVEVSKVSRGVIRAKAIEPAAKAASADSSYVDVGGFTRNPCDLVGAKLFTRLTIVA